MAKSTGPRTPRGKARSSQNAAKHWIESRRILPDEHEEAATLRSGFEDDFNPEGLMELEIIDDLVFNRLNKRRIDVVFTREFSKATIEKATSLLENRERLAVRYWLQLANLWVAYRAGHERNERLRPDTCIGALQGLTKRIRDRGPQPEDLDFLRVIYGDQPTENAAVAMRFLVKVPKSQTEKGEEVTTTDQKELQKSILDALQTEIEGQENRDALAKNLTEIECASDLEQPPRQALETLLRYRAANIREFKDLLDSLERIRRLRRSAA